MKRILVTGAGGTPSINFIRSLRLAPEEFYIIGVDADKFKLQLAPTDERYLVPLASDPDYIPTLNLLITEKNIQFLHAQNDQEIATVSEYRDQLKARTYLPDPRTVKTCGDKFASYEKWRKAGLKLPRTILVQNREDLERAFLELGPMIWVREISGAFGKGSFFTTDPDQARPWIEFHKGWGHFSAAEYLSPQSSTWQSIWRFGELIVAQGRKRLYWEFSNRSPSGVTGLTGTGVTISDRMVDEIAQRAILAIDPSPHGIFSVDLTYDREGIPNPTEINIGRFFTTHLFFSTAGLNMPYLLIKLAFNEELPPITQKVNPLPPGLAWVRGLDTEPVLTTLADIDSYEENLRKRRTQLKGSVSGWSSS